MILLDNAFSLTLGVILFYQPVSVEIYQEANSLDEAYSLTLSVISILSVCASQSLSGSYFT